MNKMVLLMRIFWGFCVGTWKSQCPTISWRHFIYWRECVKNMWVMKAVLYNLIHHFMKFTSSMASFG